MLYLDKVVFIKWTLNKQFPMMSTWTNEDIKRRIEDEYMSNGFGKGDVEPPPHVAQPIEAEQQVAEDNRMTEI